MAAPLKLLIVTGLSGAGKTITLHSLEDMGAYCVDNLPVNLLPAFAIQTHELGLSHDCVAVGIDARTIAVQDMPALLQGLTDNAIAYEVVFLEADDTVLIKRFSETRRKHPLTSTDVPLPEAIKRERELLAPLASQADIRLNTSHMHVHQLRDQIRLRVQLSVAESMSVLFQSFGFKSGVPTDADIVFDVRCLPNPHWQVELRRWTGRDPAIIAYLEAQPKAQHMLADLKQFLTTWIPEFAANNRSYLTVAIGCTGGKHRSVYMAEQLAAHFKPQHPNVLVRHRELS